MKKPLDLGRSVVELLSSPDILHFDNTIPTVLTPPEGNAIIEAILRRQTVEDAPIVFVVDRLDDLVIRIFHSYGTLTPENERALKTWLLENAYAGGNHTDFVVAACDIINHFTGIDRRGAFQELLLRTRQTKTRRIIENYIADLDMPRDPE